MLPQKCILIILSYSIDILFVRFEVLTTVTEDYCLLKCDIVLFGRLLPMFWRNFMPPSSGWKNKPRMERSGLGRASTGTGLPVARLPYPILIPLFLFLQSSLHLCAYLYHFFHLGLYFCPEDGGSRFLWNIDNSLLDMLHHIAEGSILYTGVWERNSGSGKTIDAGAIVEIGFAQGP
jgi:hypothetical protein